MSHRDPPAGAALSRRINRPKPFALTSQKSNPPQHAIEEICAKYDDLLLKNDGHRANSGEFVAESPTAAGLVSRCPNASRRSGLASPKPR